VKYGVYSIRDARTGFLPPTVDQNDSSAMRNFAHVCMQKESLLFSHIDFIRASWLRSSTASWSK
jgi:hypothetical protein